MQEREDWDTPDIESPARLTQTEAELVYRELSAGADEGKLALYLNTSVGVIRQAFAYIDRNKRISKARKYGK